MRRQGETTVTPRDTQGQKYSSISRYLRERSFGLPLFLLLLVVLSPRPAGAATAPKLPTIQLTYRGGPLIQHAKVATLYWGSSWMVGSSLTGYFDSFFQALFADGRFMANLAQYSAGGYTIENGSFVATDTDTQDPSAKVTDAQIQSEISAQIAAGHLPQPDEDTVYFVFTPPGVVVYDRFGDNSVDNFAAYHDYRFGSDGFAYAVIPYDSSLRDPRVMTVYASHELAEAVTDPEPYDTTVAWYDDNYGEIGDIPATLLDANQITVADYVNQLSGSDGTNYLVQTVWSLQDNAPVAFASGG
jgi:hypothetical protein